jgi:outer membrane protein OmpA-like peptidoglycan-associated protein
VTVDVAAGGQVRADIALVAVPVAAGLFRGSVVDMRNEPVQAHVVIGGGGPGQVVVDVKEGFFETELPPGRYHAVVQAPGFLLQAVQLTIEPGGRTVRAFTLKPEPKKRMTLAKADRVELQTPVPFQLGGPRLLAAAEFILDDLADLLLGQPVLGKVRVEGTQGPGKDAGEELARARAEAVIDFLIARGVPAERLEAGVAPVEGDEKGKGGVQILLLGDAGGAS